jgi:hypothetical protein
MTARARAATSDELVKLRSDAQWTRYKLAVIVPPIVFAALVNGTFTSVDQVTTIPYDTVTSGAYTAVVAGMTLLVGSAAGKSDLGQARVRKITATTITIGRTSDISWADNLYLTVVDEFLPWTKQPGVLSDNIKLDDDVLYSDQHAKMNPVPIMGPDVALLAGVTYSPDGSNSFVLDGSTISTYAWTVTGGTIANAATATPTITLTGGGYHRLSLTVTTSNGKSTTGHRVIWVYDGTHPLLDQFSIDTFQGDASEGGWQVRVTLYDQAGQTQIQDRAHVILLAQDYAGGVAVSLGQVPGAEAVAFNGWISGATIDYQREYGTVSFSAYTLNWWMDKLGSPSSFVEGTASAPTTWMQMQSCTLDKALWHWLYWRCTVIEIADVYLTGSATLFGGVVASMGSIWSQINESVTNRALAKARCDRLGRLFVETDPQMIPVANRGAIPVIMAITKNDWTDEIDIQQRTVQDVGMVELAALATSGGNTNVVMSRSPGIAWGRFGKVDKRDRLIVASQADANSLSAMIRAKMNNPYPRVMINLASDNRLIDIAPNQYATLSIDAADTPRGVTWTNKRMIPSRVEHRFDDKSGAVTTGVEYEPETSGGLSVTVDAPQQPIVVFPKQPPLVIPGWSIGSGGSFPGLDLPDVIPQDPSIPETPPCKENAAADPNGPFNTWMGSSILSSDTYSKVAPIRFYARAGSSTSPTRYTLNGTWWEWDGAGNWNPTTSDDWYNVYLLDNQFNRICTGTKDPVTNPFQRTGTFNLAAGTQVAYVEVALTKDATNRLGASGAYEMSGASLVGVGDIDAGTLVTSYDVYSSKATLTNQIVQYRSPGYTLGGLNFPLLSGGAPLYLMMDVKMRYVITGSGYMSGKTIEFSGRYRTDDVIYDGVTEYRGPYSQFYGAMNGVHVEAKRVLSGSMTSEYPAYLYTSMEIEIKPFPTHKLDINSLLLWNICGA